jgi:uncharacterized protein (TIGR03437 family)
MAASSTSRRRCCSRAASPAPGPESRLYGFGPAGLTLYAERGALAPQDTGSSNDGVSHPSVSGDGSVIGFTYRGVCASAACDKIVNRAEVRARVTLDLGPSHVQISRNGRWALLTTERSMRDPANPLVGGILVELTLIDLSNGQRTTVPWAAPVIAPLISDGGVLLMRWADLIGPGGISIPEYGIWRQGNFATVPIPLDAKFVPLAISDDATTLVAYEQSTPYVGPITRVAIVSIPAKTVTTMIEVKDPEHIPAVYSIANDGQRVLYSVDGSAYVWDAATRTSILVPLASGELATGGVLSGNGKLAFVSTSRARIARFDVASKALSDLFPRTPRCEDPGPLAGGSLARLACNFNVPAAGLEGKLMLNGNAVPVLYSGSGEIGVQIPWQSAFVPPSTLTYNVPGDPPFQPTQELRVYDGAPAIVPAELGLFGMKIVKSDWSGLVTALPASGDLFHIYMTGLGWTQTPETTGVPASLTKPNPIQWSLACHWTPTLEPLELLFAGLAPGTLGIYQTTFRMRPRLPVADPIAGFQCYLRSPAMVDGFGPGTPVRGIYGSGAVIGIPPTPQPPPR